MINNETLLILDYSINCVIGVMRSVMAQRSEIAVG